jgi:hypothetical protein
VAADLAAHFYPEIIPIPSEMTQPIKIKSLVLNTVQSAVIALFFSFGLVAPVAADELEGAESGVPTREDAVLVSITATIEAIDYKTREATLKGPLGNTVTFTVDQRVKRLKEFKVGDAVTADYFVSLAFELREPTAEERAEPLVIVEGAGKAPAGTTPAAGGLSQIKAVCTIEGLDRPTETATLKGPLGRYVTVRVADPANLPHLRIGETVVVTYTEALAIALEPAETNKEYTVIPQR